MHSIKGIVKNGQIIPSEPADWPEGTEVWIKPITATEESERDNGGTGMSEDEQGDDPEAISQWIAAFDSIEPLQMSPEEEAEWQAARQARKDFEKARFFEHAETLRRMCE